MVSQVSMGKDVIDIVHAMADRDNMPSGLKITTRSGIILHDNTSIAGVDGADANETNDNIEIDNDNDELDPNDIGHIVPEVKHHKQHEQEDDEEYPKELTYQS